MGLTKLEIINETVEYYSADVSRRSITVKYSEEDEFHEDPYTSCMYHGDDGKQCAFSRCCKEGVDLSKYEETSADNVLTNEGQEILKEEYRGHDLEFWNSVQRFHDNEWYWNELGLTDSGNKYVEELKTKYAE